MPLLVGHIGEDLAAKLTGHRRPPRVVRVHRGVEAGVELHLLPGGGGHGLGLPDLVGDHERLATLPLELDVVHVAAVTEEQDPGVQGYSNRFYFPR